MTTYMTVPVHALQPGDITSFTEETIISVQRGARTPNGKMEVIIERKGERRKVLWGKYTHIKVRRS